MSTFGKSPLRAALRWLEFKHLAEYVAADAFNRYYDKPKRNKMSKKYLYDVRVTVSQSFTVLAENEAAARAIAMDDDAWHHLEDIGAKGDIDASVTGSAQLDWPQYKLGIYQEDGDHRCIFCHTPIQYGTGSDYTCECEVEP